MNRRRNLDVAGGIVALLVGSLAWSESSELPAPQALFARHIDAAYGKKGLKQVSAMTLQGRMAIRYLKVDEELTVMTEAPDKYAYKFKLKDFQVLRFCSAGECWTQEVGRPLVALEGEMLRWRLEQADYYRFEHMEKYYDQLETMPETSESDTSAYEVRAAKKGGIEDFYYFSKDTGLLKSSVVTAIVPGMSQQQFTKDIKKYEAFDGVMVPTAWAESSPIGSAEITISSVSFADIPETMFVPAGSQ